MMRIPSGERSDCALASLLWITAISFRGRPRMGQYKKKFLTRAQDLICCSVGVTVQRDFYKELIEELCSVGVTDQPSIVE
jgi:hypothetical protein